MATLTLRLVKGSTLNFTELDNNFIALNNEKIERDGSVPFTGAQRFIAGTAAAPGITFVGDTNTGIFSPGADQISFTTNGTSRLTINASGNISFSGTLSGNGSGLTSLNASNITTGTLSDAQLSSNVALRNVNNHFTVPQNINGGANGGLTIIASVTAQVNWDNTGAAANNRLWTAFNDTSGYWGVYSYLDGGTGGIPALRIARTNNIPGVVQTYGNLLAGGTQSGIGRVGFEVGTATNSGYVAFYDSNQVRQGYIGASTTTGGGDSGTIPYVAGMHSFTGNIEIAGTSRRIIGDFSSATVSNRVLFQTSVANSSTALGVIPSGSGTVGAYNAYASSDPANSSFAQLVVVGGSEVRVVSNQSGSGAVLPMRFYMGGNVAAEISTNRNVTINAPASGNPLDARWSAEDGVVLGGTSTNVSSRVALGREGTNVFGVFYDRSTGNGGLWHGTSTTGSRNDRLVISPQGNITISQPSSGIALTANGLALGSNGGDSQQIASFVSADANATQFALYNYRLSNGSTHDTSETRLYRRVDSTNMGFIGFASNADRRIVLGDGNEIRLQINNHGRVSVNSTSNDETFLVSGSARTVPVSVSFSATPTFNARQSNVFYFGTLTGNVTSMTISNPTDGQTINIRFVQDGTGGRTVTLPSGTQVSGSLNTAANAVTWLVITYVSSASRWEGTWTRVS